MIYVYRHTTYSLITRRLSVRLNVDLDVGTYQHFQNNHGFVLFINLL